MLFIFFLFHSYIFFFLPLDCGRKHTVWKRPPQSRGGAAKVDAPWQISSDADHLSTRESLKSWRWLEKWVTLSSQSHSFHNKFGTFHLEANFTWNLEIVGKRKNTLAVQGTLLGLNLDKSQGTQMELPPLKNTPQCVASKEVPALTSQLSVCGKQTWQQPAGPTTPTFF